MNLSKKLNFKIYFSNFLRKILKNVYDLIELSLEGANNKKNFRIEIQRNRELKKRKLFNLRQI
jgi:hypothetical protein